MLEARERKAGARLQRMEDMLQAIEVAYQQREEKKHTEQPGHAEQEARQDAATKIERWTVPHVIDEDGQDSHPPAPPGSSQSEPADTAGDNCSSWVSRWTLCNSHRETALSAHHDLEKVEPPAVLARSDDQLGHLPPVTPKRTEPTDQATRLPPATINRPQRDVNHSATKAAAAASRPSGVPSSQHESSQLIEAA